MWYERMIGASRKGLEALMIESDCIEKVGRSIVQHGPLNQRVYLMKLDRRDLPHIVTRLLELAAGRDYGKILAKVPASAEADFRRAGFECEARIPGFFEGGEAACFMARFFDAARKIEFHPQTVERCRNQVAAAAPVAGNNPPTGGPAIRVCRPADLSAMQHLYRQVFESYPFPIHDRGYLAATMDAHVRYYGAGDRTNRLVALASCELDPENQAVEMTDFAVLPSWRRRGLCSRLLRRMETDMRRRGLRTAFTIARTRSPGINIVFHRCGYRRCGTLVNNTHIAGEIESMWVWHKSLTP